MNRTDSAVELSEEVVEAKDILTELTAEESVRDWAVLTLAGCQIRNGGGAQARTLLQGLAPEVQQDPQVQLLFADLKEETTRSRYRGV